MKETSYAATSDAVNKASETYLKGTLEYAADEVVSSDFIHKPRFVHLRRRILHRVEQTLPQLVSWYDNEWGYSCRVAD